MSSPAEPIPDAEPVPGAEPTTEAVNPHSCDLDRLSAAAIARLMNAQDAGVLRAVGAQSDRIGAAIDKVAARLRAGGRLFYVGAGTSGRLGVLDAAECPPTFHTDPDLVQGVIAGGDPALRAAVEDAEDDAEQGARDLRDRGTGGRDVVVGIAASGSTPYVLGAVRYARSVGALAIAITCNSGSPLAGGADHAIELVVGPEILAGSTRLKAGTATKMVLNMISTGAMVLLGKTYGNLMVDVQPTNRKLATRTRRLLQRLTGLDTAGADALLLQCDGELKTAVIAARVGLDPAMARQRLADSGGGLRRALEAP